MSGRSIADMVVRRQGGGIEPDFSHVSLESHGSMIIGIASAFTGFAATMVLARLYVRTFMLKTMGSDDWVIIIAMLCSIAVLVFIIEEVHNGVGEHFGNPFLLAHYEQIIHLSYHHAWVIVVGNTATKISVGLFLLRLVQKRHYKRFIVAWIVFLVIFGLACVGTLIFQCIPVNAAWSFSLRMDPKTKCYSTAVFRSIGLFNGAINTFTDFVFATLPIPIILTLQVNTRTKVSLVGILSVGYFACAASIVKEVLLSKFFGETDSMFNDAFQLWNCIELNTGIIAASMPALRPLFAFLLETAATFRSSARGYHQNSGDLNYKMASLPSRSVGSKQGYGVTIVGGGDEDSERIFRKETSESSGSMGPMSRLEASIGQGDSDEKLDEVGRPDEVYDGGARRGFGRGLESVPSGTRGIMRTTEILVSR